MIDDDRPGPIAPSSANVVDLIDDFLRQQEALRAQASELAHLQAEVLNAAEREASGILTTACANIRLIILGARQDLLRLAAQVQIVTTIENEIGCT